MAKQTVHRYSLKTPSGGWFGEVILTDDKGFFALTDWGNFNFRWSATSTEIREFILGIEEGYFARKMFEGVAFQCHTRAMESCCKKFAANILPALKDAIKEEMSNETQNFSPTCATCNSYDDGKCINFGKEVKAEDSCKYYQSDVIEYTCQQCGRKYGITDSDAGHREKFCCKACENGY